MADANIVTGKITFKIERYSTLDCYDRFSQSMKIGKHSWNVAVRFCEEEGQAYLSVYLHCNQFVTESSWLTQAKRTVWLLQEGQPFHSRESLSRDFSHKHFSWGWSKFIAKSLIPSDCIVDDTLTVETKIEIYREVFSTVNFGSPIDGRVANYQDIMRERSLGGLFNNEAFSDVVFTFIQNDNKTKIFGHRQLIAVSSPVLAALMFPAEAAFVKNMQASIFYADLGVDTSDRDEHDRLIVEIDDPEVHPTALLTLLRFIYKKEVVVDRKLIKEILYAAEKYDVHEFVESLGFLVSPETVLDFFPFVFKVGKRHALYKRCNWVIRSQTKLILKTDSFLDADEEIIHDILCSDLLQTKELDLFNSYVKWTDRQLQKQAIEVTDEKRKEAMKDLVLIRFPIMSLEEFAVGPAEGKILTSDEKLDIYRSMAIKVTSKFVYKLRNF